MKKFLKTLKDKLNIKIISSFSFKPFKCNKKVFTYLGFTLPLLLAIGGASLGFIESNKKNNLNVLVEVKSNKLHKRVYLISKDHLTVPLTVELEKRNTLQEYIVDIFNLLRESSSLNNEYVKGFIKDDVALNSFEIVNANLNLDLSEEFLSSSKEDEIHIFEALTLSFVQFDEIDSLTISVNGNKFTSFSDSTYKIPPILDKSIGINNKFQSTLDIINKERVTIFYSKEVDEKTSYLIPLTFYEEGKNKTVAFVNALQEKEDYTLELKYIETYKSISLEQKESEEYSFTIEEEALVDEDVVSKDLYNLVSLSLDLMGVNSKVSFVLEGEIMQVDGIYSEEDMEVSSIIYNSVSI